MVLSCIKPPIPPDDCLGPVDPGCAHTLEYAPVCGCDGVTYGNRGEAKCAGVKKWNEGPCKKRE